jgi:iron complex transport system permease protein
VARIFVGADNRYLLPCSAFLGATLLLVSDLVGRVIIYPSTIQAGVIMSFLGGPMFLWLIMRRKSKIWS